MHWAYTGCGPATDVDGASRATTTGTFIAIPGIEGTLCLANSCKGVVEDLEMLMRPVRFLPSARGVNGTKSQNKGRQNIAALCGRWRCGTLATVGDGGLLNERHVTLSASGTKCVFAVVAM